MKKGDICVDSLTPEPSSYCVIYKKVKKYKFAGDELHLKSSGGFTYTIMSNDRFLIILNTILNENL